MNKHITEKVKIDPKGLVTRRLIDTRKLFTEAINRGVKFELTFDEMLLEYKSSTFRAITIKMAKELGNDLTESLIDQSVKSQFADNKLWLFIKRHFNRDIQIPFVTGIYTKSPITRPNLVVATGHARYSGQIGGTTTTPMTALAVGTSGTAPASGDTALGAEITTSGLARGAATISQITTTYTNDTTQWQKTWTVTGTQGIQEEGIFDNNTSGGTLLAHNTFSVVSVVNGDTFQITHDIQS